MCIFKTKRINRQQKRGIFPLFCMCNSQIQYSVIVPLLFMRIASSHIVSTPFEKPIPKEAGKDNDGLTEIIVCPYPKTNAASFMLFVPVRSTLVIKVPFFA